MFRRGSSSGIKAPTSPALLEVRTFQELLAGVARAAAQPTRPLCVTIADSMLATSQVVMPASCENLAIRSVVGAVVTIGADIPALFSINASYQSVEGVRILVNDDDLNADYLVSVDAPLGVQGISISHNHLVSTQGIGQSIGIVNATDSQIGYSIISSNRAIGIGMKDIVRGVFLTSFISGNVCNGAGSIVMIGGTGLNSIMGNHVAGGTIDTAATSGGNIVAGNSAVGSFLSDITDAVGLNT